MNTYFVLTIFSDACAIELDDSRWLPLVVVTGGRGTRSGSDRYKKVQVYTSEGPQEQLPSLQTGRYSHACAYYVDSQDRIVSTYYYYLLNESNIIIIIIISLIFTSKTHRK